MFKKNTLLRALLAAGLTTGLAACGGGSSGNDGGGEAQPKIQTGKFVDSPVGGLEFETSSGISGLTTDKGQFTYREGDNVSFRIGALNIGSTSGGAVVTPLTLTASNENQAANIARLLQTLDDDGIPGNGITITNSTRTKAFNQNSADAATVNLDNAAATALITALTKGNSVPQTTIVSAEDALEHLNGTLNNLNPVESCADASENITASRLEGKTFGFIKSDEILIFQFAADGRLSEYQYDKQNGGRLKDGEASTWSLNGNTLTFGGSESFTACATSTSILLEKGEEVAALYDAKPYSLPDSTQSFIIAYDGTEQAVLTIRSDGSLDYFPAETPISDASKGSVNVETGALDLDFDEGDVIDSVYFLAGQGKRTGIYLDYNESGALSRIGVATVIADSTPVSADTFNNQTFVYRNEEANEIIIHAYNSDGTFEDFKNDCYEDGQQDACYSKANWSFNKGTQTLTEEYSATNTEKHKVAQSGAELYLADPSVEDVEIESVRKTNPIDEDAFAGSYTIDIPTENTRLNSLTVNSNGDCNYEGTSCSWAITASGKAEITFGAGSDATANIWQLAGSSGTFAFVITHDDNENDIEPGLMTHK